MTPNSRQTRRVGSAQKEDIKERDNTKERNGRMTLVYPVVGERFCEVKNTNTRISLELTKRSFRNFKDT